MRDRQGVDLEVKRGEEELRRLEGEKSIIRLYYMRKECIFNKQKEKCKKKGINFITRKMLLKE